MWKPTVQAAHWQYSALHPWGPAVAAVKLCRGEPLLQKEASYALLSMERCFLRSNTDQGGDRQWFWDTINSKEMS